MAGNWRAFRDGLKAEQNPVRLERVAGHRRKQKTAAPADQFPDRRLNLLSDLGQLIELRIEPVSAA